MATSTLARPTARAASSSAARGEARRAAQRRRGWVIFGGAVVLSALMLVAWFPFGSLLAQHRAISSASAELANLTNQDRQLHQEQAKLNSPAEIKRLAREQYQLVEPGQSLVQVLPPSGAPSASGSGQAPYPGDPGLAKPIEPSASALLTQGATASAVAHHAASAHRSTTAAPSSLWQRIVSTLTFWRR